MANPLESWFNTLRKNGWKAKVKIVKVLPLKKVKTNSLPNLGLAADLAIFPKAKSSQLSLKSP